MKFPGRVPTLSRIRCLRAAVLGGALVALGACGLHRGYPPERAEALLTETEPRSLACAPESYPEELPNVASVVDSAALQGWVQGLIRQDQPPTGYVLLTLEFDPAGVNVRRDLIEHNTPPAVADSVQRLVFAARVQAPESERTWGVRLRIDLEEPAVMRTGRREYCPPIARDASLYRLMQSYNPPGVRFRRGMRERTIFMRVRINPYGGVSSAHVARGDLSGGSLERDIAQFLRQFFFNPATVDGVPTSGWVEIPVRVRS
jgi:hypothetical protein